MLSSVLRILGVRVKSARSLDILRWLAKQTCRIPMPTTKDRKTHQSAALPLVARNGVRATVGHFSKPELGGIVAD